MGSDEKAVAFVLHMGENGLGIARSLGRAGIPVVGMDFDPHAPGLKSRYCRPLLTRDPAKDPEEVLNILLDEGRQLSRKGVLYPASDALLLFVSRYRRELSEYFLYAMPSEELIESIVNKRRQYELAERIGIPYPKTYYPETLHDVEAIKDEIEYPAFIKGYYGHLWTPIFRSKGFVVRGPSELIERYKRIFDAKLQALVQSVIIGPPTNVAIVCAYLSEGSEPTAAFVARSIRRYPKHAGSNVTCKVSVHDEHLLQAGLKFFQGINYRGTGEIQFKKDERNGNDYRLIELNARFWVGNIQATCAGTNLPLIQYLDLTNQPIKQANDYKDGVTWLDIVQDFGAFLELNKEGKLPLLSWLRSVRAADCEAFLARDDLKPFLKNIENYGKRFAPLVHLVRHGPSISSC